MANLNEDQLNHLRDLAVNNPKIKEAMDAKQASVNSLNKSLQRGERLTPSYRPSGAPSIGNADRLTPDQYNNFAFEKERLIEMNDARIEETVREEFKANYQTEYKQVQTLSRYDLNELLEDGPDKILDRQKEQKQEKNTKVDQSIKMSVEQSREVFGEISEDKTIEDKSDLNLNKEDISKSIHMNEEKSKTFFETVDIDNDWDALEPDPNKEPTPDKTNGIDIDKE
ncbi:MAG: hypothetical protein WBG71_10360 [Leeuwenhoekiella sp.]